MHSSKIAKISKTVVFCIVLIICSKTLTYFLYPLSSLNIKFEKYHSIKDNIDTLVIGDSLEGNFFNRKVLSEEFDTNAFVFSPQGSYPESHYFILLDAINQHKIKNLIVGWDIMQDFQDPEYIYPHSEEIYREFVVDFKGNPKLAWTITDKILNQRYTSTFFDWSSFPENIKEIPAVLKSKKRTVQEAAAIELENKAENFPTVITENGWKALDEVRKRSFSNTLFAKDKENILKIKNLCEENGINLIVESTPIPAIVLKEKPELYECMKVSEEFFSENNIKYINLSNQNIFPGSNEDHRYHDCWGHFSRKYQEEMTKLFCDYVKANNLL